MEESAFDIVASPLISLSYPHISFYYLRYVRQGLGRVATWDPRHPCLRTDAD
jgi:hypothetical protein